MPPSAEVPAPQNRDCRLYVYLTPQERKVLEVVARAHRCSSSTFARLMIMQGIKSLSMKEEK